MLASLNFDCSRDFYRQEVSRKPQTAIESFLDNSRFSDKICSIRDLNIQVIEENINSLTIVLHRESDRGELNFTDLLEAIGNELARTVLEKNEYSSVQSSAIGRSIFPSHPQLQKVFHFIEQNYHEPINLEDVAKAVGYSSAYLTDLVRRQTGKSVCRWIAERRMVETCHLLKHTDHTVETIAELVGYRNLGSFFRQFRQRFGETPQAWRNAQQY